MVQLASSVVDDTLAITSLAIDRDAGEIVLGVAAKTDSEPLDPAVAAVYPNAVARGANVTVKVYHAETLGGAWALVKTQQVEISPASTEVRAPLDGVDTKSGFFKVEIEQ